MATIFVPLMLIEIIDDFNLKGKILALTTDNASNNNTFIGDMLLAGYLDSIESHQRCFAHVLNLSAHDALREIKTSVDGLRELVKAIRVSPKRLQTFKEICGELSVEFLTPILDVATR